MYPPRYRGLEISRIPVHFLSEASGMIEGPLEPLDDRPHVTMAWSRPWALESDFRGLLPSLPHQVNNFSFSCQ